MRARGPGRLRGHRRLSAGGVAPLRTLLTLVAGLCLGGLAHAQAPPCTSAKACKRACKKGGAAACNELGARYYTGEGVRASDTKARRHYQLACDLNDLMGCTNLAWMALDGLGGPADEGGARASFQRACAGGEPLGCGGLGTLQAAAGAGLKARENLEKGCQAGDGRACRSLGGIMKVPYPAASAGAYERGCAADDGPSCAEAAATAPPAQAEGLRQRACSRGDGPSCAGCAAGWRTW